MTEESQTEAEELRREPPAMDPEMLARREAALRHVRKFGDPVLKSRAVEVEGFDEALRAEIDRMGLLMEDAIGVGLAANQVGLLRRFFVYRVSDEGPLQALVNPVIENSAIGSAIIGARTRKRPSRRGASACRRLSSR